ncbi:MAG TPA: type IX secretion system outer membrane channel protein PorV [Rhodothermia bacterium]
MTESRSRMLGMAVGVVALLMSVGNRTAMGQVGAAAVPFLQIEPDSRAAAMGNANVAVAGDANAVFWNPAGLAFQEGIEGSITHSQWLPEFDAGLFFDYVSGKYHVPDWGTFGMHITYLNLGEHECRDEGNNPCGTFRSYDLAVGGSYGFKVSEKFALGSGLRLIYSNLAPGQLVGTQETKAGVSVGFDLAGLFKTAPFSAGGVQSQASFGFNLANMGPTIQYSDSEQSDPIPTNFRFGWSYKMDFDEYNSLRITNDFTKLLVDRDSTGAESWYKAVFSSWKSIGVNTGTQDNRELDQLSVIDQLTIGMGLEYWYNNLFALRGGYFYENPDNGNREFLTLGAGIRYNILGVDFSYIYPLEENHPLADTIRFSVIVGR